VDFLHSANLVVTQSKTTKLHVLLGDGFHLQAGPDYSHGRSAKYTGNINKLGFHGRLFFSLGCYWSFGSSAEGSGLLSSADACGSAVPGICCAI
jgi:hypothetical protein